MSPKRARRRAIRGRVYGPGPSPRLVLDDTLADDTTIRLRIQDPAAEQASAIRLTDRDAEDLARDLLVRVDVVRGNQPPRQVPAPRDPATGPVPAQPQEAPHGQ